MDIDIQDLQLEGMSASQAGSYAVLKATHSEADDAVLLRAADELASFVDGRVLKGQGRIVAQAMADRLDAIFREETFETELVHIAEVD